MKIQWSLDTQKVAHRVSRSEDPVVFRRRKRGPQSETEDYLQLKYFIQPI